MSVGYETTWIPSSGLSTFAWIFFATTLAGTMKKGATQLSHDKTKTALLSILLVG